MAWGFFAWRTEEEGALMGVRRCGFQDCEGDSQPRLPQPRHSLSCACRILPLRLR